ncbi:hypothetical protein EGR_01995 [Echinococcus granulosus]|uniref:Uncharacterized protein n=1 Tax=Echinococcus granulosus TaxID=6210 RepID=W6UR89_ECHGR|nr:hypothetical protein EGR_01995 [Echinococcus granulosus]EUB63191.1 hypothetical protein EGR_01995 [Echinococcus granulosus]
MPFKLKPCHQKFAFCLHLCIILNSSICIHLNFSLHKTNIQLDWSQCVTAANKQANYFGWTVVNSIVLIPYLCMTNLSDGNSRFKVIILICLRQVFKLLKKIVFLSETDFARINSLKRDANHTINESLQLRCSNKINHCVLKQQYCYGNIHCLDTASKSLLSTFEKRLSGLYMEIEPKVAKQFGEGVILLSHRLFWAVKTNAGIKSQLRWKAAIIFCAAQIQNKMMFTSCPSSLSIKALSAKITFAYFLVNPIKQDYASKTQSKYQNFDFKNNLNVEFLFMIRGIIVFTRRYYRNKVLKNSLIFLLRLVCFKKLQKHFTSTTSNLTKTLCSIPKSASKTFQKQPKTFEPHYILCELCN